MSVLAKGDPAFEYGVPWQELDWQTMSPELVDWPGREAANLTLIDEPSAWRNSFTQACGTPKGRYREDVPRRRSPDRDPSRPVCPHLRGHSQKWIGAGPLFHA